MSGVKNEAEGPGTMAHICNSSYLAGWDQEDWGSRPA
jgi:hypothetical protein